MARRDRVAGAAIAATIAVSALAVGSATRHTALVAAALGLGCGTVYWRSRRGLLWPPLLWLLAIGVAATALQLVPLPSRVIDLLGAKGELLAGNAAALGEPPVALASITYDPASTWLELAKLIGYLGFAVCCMRAAESSRGRRRIAAAIAGCGGLVAATTAVHEIAGAGALYGIYEPRYAGEQPLFGPFLNPNHLAGLMALATPVAAALAADARGRGRLVWGGCAALTAVVAMLTLSRTGAVSLLIGAVAVAALAAPMIRKRRRHRRRPLGSNRVAGILIAATCAAIALATAGRGLVDELASTEVDEVTGQRGKVAVWGEALEVLWANKWTGVGRGAFEFAAPSSDTNLTYSHVENEVLQAAVDWGLPIAALALAVLVLAGRAAARRARDGLIEAGLAAGLVAIGVHQLADFTLELPGAAYPTLAAFAVLARGEIARVRRTRWRLAAVIAGAAGIAAAASPPGVPARAETDALAAAFADRDAREALEPALATWRRHPGDFIAAAQVASALFARGDERAVAVINQALARSPAHPGLHLLAARMLRASQRAEQALIEYRAAIARAADPAAVIRELLAAFPDPRIAAGGLPRDPRFGRRTLAAVARLGAHELGFRYSSALVGLRPDSAHFHAARVFHALQTGRADEAVESARIAASHGAPGSTLALARALVARGDHAEAEAVLAAGRGEVRPKRERIAELRLIARARRAQGKHAAAIASLAAAIELSGSAAASAPLYRELAAAQDAAGQPNAAAASRRRAAAIERRIE